jgi:hypothetical protein
MTVPASHPSAPPQSGPRAQPGGQRLLTGWEQSRLSWARVAEFYDEIPAAYRVWLDPLIRGRESFPYIVLTPTYEGYFRRENEKLVCMVDGALHIVERARDRLVPVSYRLEDISAIEVGSILLRGWITVRGLAASGVPSSSTLRFNTVTDRLFAPFVSAFRLGSRPLSGAELDAERAKFDELLARNYKFMNYSRGSIMPGEAVLCYVLQPEIREPLLHLFGRSLSRCISPTHIAILTDRELIVISEESGSLWQSFGAIRYGGIWQYVPLDRISAASLATREDGRINLSVHLPREERLDMHFSPGSRAEVESLVDTLDSLPREAPARRGT